MRILALNHFFDQDLAALRHQAGDAHVIRWVHFPFFRDRFRRLFPDEVLGTDFGAFWEPEHARARAKWRRACRGALHELYQLFPFELVILPSDIFPYIRDVIPAAHELGIPVVVVQKETTISPYTLEVHSRKIGEHYPFIADHMTVCSDRQKQFWLNAGARDERITVTGQPRFDFYFDRSRWSTLADLGVRTLPGRKVILFLSYWLGAYIPIEDYDRGLDWSPLRGETEETLMELVNGGEYQLLIKPHPQQPLQDIAKIREHLARLEQTPGSAQVLPASLDTRHLLVNADVIVGFQTTALLEALLLGRNVIYTCWGEAHGVCKEGILPYEQHSEAIHTASSAGELRSFVLGHEREGDATSESARMALFDEYLGIADGRASARALDMLASIVESYQPEDARHARELRASLARSRRPQLVLDGARLGAQLALDVPAGLAAIAAGRALGKPEAERWARSQLRLRAAHGGELLESLRDAPARHGELVGRRLSPWLGGLRELARGLSGS